MNTRGYRDLGPPPLLISIFARIIMSILIKKSDTGLSNQINQFCSNIYKFADNLGTIVYSLKRTQSATSIPGPNDSTRVYFNHVKMTILKDRFYCSDNNELLKEQKFIK